MTKDKTCLECAYLKGAKCILHDFYVMYPEPCNKHTSIPSIYNPLEVIKGFGRAITAIIKLATKRNNVNKG